MSQQNTSFTHNSRSQGNSSNNNSSSSNGGGQVEFDIESPRLLPIISYPRPCCDSAGNSYAERIAEMKSLGVTSIILGGKTLVNGINIVGKGCVGLVVKARIGSSSNNVYALKIRRTDANRSSMYEEARLHKLANTFAGVGPSLVGYSKNLLIMDFIPGTDIINWVSRAGGGDDDQEKKNKDGYKVCQMVRSVLEQCYSLDRARIDHGQLSRLDRHVIVISSPCCSSSSSFVPLSDAAVLAAATTAITTAIIDFESASTARKTCNVTAAAQSIFLNGAVASRVKRILGEPDREKVIGALRTYKQSQSRANFDAVLDSLSIIK